MHNIMHISPKHDNTINKTKIFFLHYLPDTNLHNFLGYTTKVVEFMCLVASAVSSMQDQHSASCIQLWTSPGRGGRELRASLIQNRVKFRSSVVPSYSLTDCYSLPTKRFDYNVLLLFIYREMLKMFAFDEFLGKFGACNFVSKFGDQFPIKCFGLFLTFLSLF